MLADVSNHCSTQICQLASVLPSLFGFCVAGCDKKRSLHPLAMRANPIWGSSPGSSGCPAGASSWRCPHPDLCLWDGDISISKHLNSLLGYDEVAGNPEVKTTALSPWQSFATLLLGSAHLLSLPDPVTLFLLPGPQSKRQICRARYMQCGAAGSTSHCSL